MILIVLGLQCYLLYKLFGNLDMVLLPETILAHTSISVLATFIFARLLPSNFDKPSTNFVPLFFITIFMLPVLGVLGLGLLLLHGLYYIQPAKQPFKIKLNSIPPLPDVLPEAPLTRNASDTNPACCFKSEDPKKRLDTLIATVQLRDRDAVPMLRQALLDPVKKIRSLAQEVIDQKQTIINERIQSQLDSTQPADCLFFQRITSDYWELVHSGLVQGELSQNALNRACQQIYVGLERYPDNAMLHFQLARLLLHNKKFKEAKAEFEKAKHLGVDDQKLLPYFAEIAFYSKRFDLVQQFMRDVSVPTSYSRLSASASYWHQVNI